MDENGRSRLVSQRYLNNIHEKGKDIKRILYGKVLKDAQKTWLLTPPAGFGMMIFVIAFALHEFAIPR